ncbi:snRNA-activating protein complex subunit 2 [Colossoma macropomum]|uniref:snRNA-activating protein complex subunit 2 n=1 Tax=Colossoma macropomum TaxID=42526 RepID=UPI001863C2BC|nr:snRNA-activating protein complex subunit 2 [Colossoma macropomum]XP_036453391.1 snRNA-activating protein complex subunit 2 [Colossoma macropomum]XP_036453392.1 snRNA-activating protein complex subunit 2 [Colossoma macropomum]XP_036453393.1 snRNA-activating protein complex subunit 2 [Colossoma macropomum]XP_036453394.1 snRNA-activating protein complex subunit 2 [Colossoma macropomum]XP_036453395.1 snRNA-activating protein complex subunit 2 [Colossoma macropomum]
MKPPSRHRIAPSQFLPLKRTESTRRFFLGWKKQEKRNLLHGLKQQQRLNSELDLLELRKKVPKRTLLEIQNLIKYLRTRVVWRVHQQVQKQKGEERRTKAPIEIWAELAEKMAGIHEETISSAFSQMLVIAATEPCSRQHSDPPRFCNILSPAANHPSTVPMRPTSRSHSESELPASPSPVTVQPGGTCKPPSQSPGNDGTSSLSGISTMGTSSLIQPSSISSIEEGSDCAQPSSNVAGQASEKPSTPSAPKSDLCQLTSSQNHTVSKPTPPVPTTTAASTASVSLSSSSNQLDKQDERQSEQPRSMRMKYTIDFEKIYQFMSDINSQNHSLTLTAMESAVLLDLLMSLPEELPLLDCKELQHHLLQVHTRLTTPPVNAVSIPRTDQRPAPAEPVTAGITKQTATVDQRAKCATGQNVQKEGDSNLVSKQGNSAGLPVSEGEGSSQSSAVNPPKDGGNWAEAGLCPLNPFMVPIALLKRQES